MLHHLGQPGALVAAGLALLPMVLLTIAMTTVGLLSLALSTPRREHALSVLEVLKESLEVIKPKPR